MPKSAKKGSNNKKTSTTKKVENKEIKKEEKTVASAKTNSSNKKTNSKTNKKNNAKSNNKKKSWFREFKAELKKIVWPNKSELLENTVVVISMVAIVAVTIIVLDLGFKALNRLEVDAAKAIKNTVVVSEPANEVDSSTNSENTESETETTQNETTENGVEITTTGENASTEAVWVDEGAANNQ